MYTRPNSGFFTLYLLIFAATETSIALLFHRDLLGVPLLTWTLLGIFVSGNLFFRLLTRDWLTYSFPSVVYAAPFASCYGYLGGDIGFHWWETPLARSYMDQEGVMEKVLYLGVLGLIALHAGLICAIKWLPIRSNPPSKFWATRLTRSSNLNIGNLSIIQYVVLSGFTLTMCALSAPDGTILQNQYSAALGFLNSFNFNAGWLVSYTLCILLYLDLLKTPQHSINRRQKSYIFWTLLSVIIIFFQLLKGDRESLGLIIGIVALSESYRKVNISRVVRHLKARSRPYLLYLLSAGVLMSFLAIQFIRLDGQEFIHNPKEALASTIRKYQNESIWGSILLTNLSQSAGFENGRLNYQYGATYVDYLASIVPGFVTNLIGTDRRIERDSSPQHQYMDISSGGIHILCIPYLNFGEAGVVVGLFVVGLFIGWILNQQRANAFIPQATYGAIYVYLIHWFWYGDIIMIRGVMAFVSAILLYLFFVTLRRDIHVI